MKPNLKKATKPTIIAVGLLTVVGLAASQFTPAWAGKALAGALIDKDLELALSNHIQKRFYNLINASDDQKAKLSALVSRQLDDARPIRETIRENLLDLSELMADETASDQAITQKVEAIQELRSKIQDKRLKTVLEARALLTKEQKRIVANRVKGFLTGNPRTELLRPSE